MRRITILVGMAGLPLTAGGAAAQLGCDDPAVSVSSAPASLEGYAQLFQQNGVTFYGRGAETEGAPVARILIRNGNRFPIEVSYSVLLEYAGDSLPRSLTLGRHCAQIPAGQFAAAEDAAPAPPTALRVRNLTIANLSGAGVEAAPSAGAPATGRGPVTVNVPANGTAPPAPPPAASEVRPVSPPAAPAAATRRPTASNRRPATKAKGTTTTARPRAAPKNAPVATERPPVAEKGNAALLARRDQAAPDTPLARDTPEATLPAPSAAVGATPEAPDAPRARPPANRPPALGPVRPEDGTVGAWALEATQAVFFSLSTIVLVVAGLGLVLPVLAGFALLASLGIASLRRRAARRAA